MANKEMFTVIVPNFNNEEYILEALNSIKSQTVPAKVIVVDDSSTDDSVQVAKKFLADADMGYQIIVHTINQGISKTLNEAIDKVDTKYYFILSSDDYLFHNRVIELLEEYIRQNDYPDVVMSAIMKSTDQWVKNAKSNTPQISQWMKGLQQFYGNKATLQANPDLLKLSSTIHFIKKDFVEENEINYDEDLSVGEDVLFKFRLLLAGAKVGIFEYHYYYYRIDNSNNTVSKITNEYLQHGDHIRKMIGLISDKQAAILEPFFVEYIQGNMNYIQNNLESDSRKLYLLTKMYSKLYKRLSNQVNNKKNWRLWH